MAGLRHCPRRIPLRGCGHLNIIDLLLRPLTEGTGTSLAKRTVKRVRKLRGGNKIRMTSPNSNDNPPARFYTSNAPKRVDSLTSTVIVAANQEWQLQVEICSRSFNISTSEFLDTTTQARSQRQSGKPQIRVKRWKTFGAMINEEDTSYLVCCSKTFCRNDMYSNVISCTPSPYFLLHCFLG